MVGGCRAGVDYSCEEAQAEEAWAVVEEPVDAGEGAVDGDADGDVEEDGG